MKKFLTYLLAIILLIAASVTGYLSWKLLEGTAPTIKAVDLPDIMGRSTTVSVVVKDEKSGIKNVSMELIQGEKRVELDPVIFPVRDWWVGSEVKETKRDWEIRPAELGLSEGNVLIRIHAFDSSFRNGLKGNEAILEINMDVDFTPPSIFISSSIHNIRQGGCGLVSYTVNEDIKKTGVRVGERLYFPATSPLSNSKNSYSALIAIPYDMNAPGVINIEAVDNAGNLGKAGVPFRLFPLREQEDKINISDTFLSRKLPDFVSRDPSLAGEPISTFLKINGDLRRQNNSLIKETSLLSEKEMLWKGSFKRMAGALRAGFADHRTYFYKGKEIDQAFHLGVDIASTAHAQVPASNDGKVAMVDYIGIYGNTIIIDHGMGLFSLYAHMSAVSVSKDQYVKRGQSIGQTGVTGLAGGDHLHFSILVNGVFVNPVEWWDGRWIKSHIVANLPK